MEGVGEDGYGVGVDAAEDFDGHEEEGDEGDDLELVDDLVVLRVH